MTVRASSGVRTNLHNYRVLVYDLQIVFIFTWIEDKNLLIYMFEEGELIYKQKEWTTSTDQDSGFGFVGALLKDARDSRYDNLPVF